MSFSSVVGTRDTLQTTLRVHFFVRAAARNKKHVVWRPHQVEEQLGMVTNNILNKQELFLGNRKLRCPTAQKKRK